MNTNEPLEESNERPLTAADLRERATSLPIRRRTRLLAEYAHAHRGTQAFTEMLAELAGQDSFGAELSLFLARVAEHRRHLGSLLESDDHDLARYAVRLSVELGGLDDAVETAVLNGSLELRRALYRTLRAHRRPALADRLLPAVRDRFGSDEAARLLTACSDAVVAESLPDLAHVFTAWPTLGHHHPRAFTDYAAHCLAELPSSQWAQWWTHHCGGLPGAVAAESARWIELLDRYWVEQPLERLLPKLMPRLLTAEPDAAWRFLFGAERDRLLRQGSLMRRIRRHLAGQDEETITRYLDRTGMFQTPSMRLLRFTAPSRRGRVVAASGEGNRRLPWHRHAELLPKPLRYSVVREHLARREVADSRPERERFRAFLPFAEVGDELLEHTGRAQAEARGVAYRHFITCAGLDGTDSVGRMLDALGRSAHDQDPVRITVAQSLAEIPTGAWTEAHLEQVGTLIEDMVASPSRSANTDTALLHLASRFLLIGRGRTSAAFTEFGYRHLERLAAECGDGLGTVLCALPGPSVVELCRRLVPTMNDRAVFGDHRLLRAFTDALGHRARDVTGLQDLLLRACLSAEERTAKPAVAALVKIWPEQVAALVRADPSTARFGPVFARLARDRIDLLAEHLDRDAGEVPLSKVPLSRSTTRRWPPELRAAYFERFRTVALDGRRTVHERGAAVKAIAGTAGLTTYHFDDLLADGRVRLRALAALSTASPVDRAWSLLAEHPDGREAAAGLGRIARRLRPGEIAERIGPMIEGSTIGARRGGVRLALQHHLPDAAERIQRIWSGEAVHEGIRAEIVSGLLGRLDQEWARTIVWDSVRFGADVAARAVALAPWEVPHQHREAHASFVARAIETGDERIVESGLSDVARWAQVSPSVGETLCDIASDLDSTAHWRTAMAALVGLAVHSDHWDPLIRTVRRLRADRRVEPNATPERDQPVRQRLARMLEFLQRSRGRRGPESVPDSMIEQVPVRIGLQLRLATVPWTAGAAELRAVTAPIGDPVEAVDLGEVLERRMRWSGEDDVLPFFERLVASGEANACAVAASAIAVPGARAGWTPEWRELLRRLRAHPAPVVARLARDVFTSLE